MLGPERYLAQPLSRKCQRRSALHKGGIPLLPMAVRARANRAEVAGGAQPRTVPSFRCTCTPRSIFAPQDALRTTDLSTVRPHVWRSYGQGPRRKDPRAPCHRTDASPCTGLHTTFLIVPLSHVIAASGGSDPEYRVLAKTIEQGMYVQDSKRSTEAATNTRPISRFSLTHACSPVCAMSRNVLATRVCRPRAERNCGQRLQAGVGGTGTRGRTQPVAEDTG